MTLHLAYSELRSLVTKAARGAGLEWGLAEEAGWAAEWLARADLPAAEWAGEWLGASEATALNPVAVGVALSDRLADPSAAFLPEPLPDTLPAPGYLLPFLHQIALHHGPVEMSGRCGRAALIGSDGAVAFGPAWSDRAQGWHIRPAPAPALPARAKLPTAIAAQLQTLALHTTVPASAISRRSAGAAASDND